MTKNVLITGASAGIGAATARLLAQSGFYTILIARRKEKLGILQKELGKKSSAIYELDIVSRSRVEKIFSQIEEEVGPIDVLVNNAGASFGLEHVYEANLEDWERAIDLNIKGLIYCTHAVISGMRKRDRGHIINLGSVAGSYPYPGGNVYCGTKAFVHQFSLGIRADLLGTAVRVSCIEPGLVEGTEFSIVRFRGDVAKAKRVYEKTKALTPEDIAQVIHFCITLPDHVNINTVELMPIAQAFSPLAVHRN